MFLFSSPPRQTEPLKAADLPVASHLRKAAEQTGISFDYLMKTAKRESNLNPAAKAPTSSAKGLFQFIEQTWLGLVKRDGASVGLKQAAEAIGQDRNGRYVVNDPQLKRRILDLRADPELSSKLAGIFTQKNRETLRETIGRNPDAGELYMAHFLGAQGASGLIAQAQNNPTGSAARSFPEAAAANRSIFFDAKGRARSNREVYARLAAMHRGVEAIAPDGSATAVAEGGGVDTPTRSPLAIGAGGAMARTDNAFHGLFRGGADGASAKALRKTWSGFAETRINRDAPSFFPRATTPMQVASAAESETANPATMSDATTSLAAFEALAPSDLPPPPARPQHPRHSDRAPLDLTRFRIKR